MQGPGCHWAVRTAEGKGLGAGTALGVGTGQGKPAQKEALTRKISMVPKMYMAPAKVVPK